MLVVGAGGLASELLDVISRNNHGELIFFDNQNLNNHFFYGNKMIHSFLEVKSLFKAKNDFILGLGNPIIRKDLYDRFTDLGGNLVNVVSEKSSISNVATEIGNGVCILDYALISPNVKIGKACLIYYHVSISHDCEIGDFVQLSPGVRLLGNCKIGNNVFIGANATVFPNIQVGDNVTIGAGSIVNKDIPDNRIVFGNPVKLNNGI